MDLYTVLKDFQTITAAMIALCAAALTFFGVQRAAAISYKSTQDAAKANIEWQREQAARVANNRQAALVTWLYLRATGARIKMGQASIYLNNIRSTHNFLSQSDDADIKQNQSFISVAGKILALTPIFEKSELSTIDIKFLLDFDRENQSHFFSVVQIINSFDDYIRDIQNSITLYMSSNVGIRIKGEEEIDLMIRNPIPAALFQLEMLIALETSIAKSYQQVRSDMQKEPTIPSAVTL